MGGLRDLNTRINVSWCHPRLKAEAWVFGCVRALPGAGRGNERLSVEIPVREFVYRVNVGQRAIAVVGTGGPFLAFAVGSPVPPHENAVPAVHRLVLQMIVGEDNPVAVESSFERDTVLLLQERGLSFHKPVFADEEGLRPDFILPDHKVVLEVQGYDGGEYAERKLRMHKALLSSHRYSGWRLVRYDPASGDRIRDLRGRLPG
jgi:hypothetical protein